MKKRLVSLLLALSMMLTFLPVGAVSAFAEDGTFSDGKLKYTVISETAKTAKVSGVVNANTLTEVTIQNEVTSDKSNNVYTITEIGKEAFNGCSALKSVTIGANVETIDEYAFSDTSSHQKDCEALKTVEFASGSNLKMIGQGAFANTGLTAIKLPETLETIGQYAFIYTPLTEIEIPANVKTLGRGAFIGCAKLEKVEFKGNNLKTIEEVMFQDCTALTEVELPTSLEEIGANSFWGCSALEVLDLRDLKDLKKIGRLAMADCKSLQRVYLPANAWQNLNRAMVAEVDGFSDKTNEVTIYYAGSVQDFKDTVPNGAEPQSYFYKKTIGINLVPEGFCTVKFRVSVTFENEDGSVVYAKRDLFEDDTFSAVKKPADPTKAGYTFKGWKQKDSGQMFEDIAPDTVLTAGMTFVPVWEENKAPAKTYRIVVENGTVNGNTNTAEVDAGEPVTLKPGEAPDGMSFQYWDIPQELMDALTAHSEGKFDNKNPDLTFPMPSVKAGEYTIKAMFGTPDTVDDTDYTALGIATGVVGGTVVAGILGWQAYSLASQSYLELFLPYIPTNRAELATLLWEDAGKPEMMVAEAYTDIDTDKTELQEAAHWAVAEGLMDEADPEDEHVFAPNNGVSNWTIIKAWHKAQKLKKG